MKVALPLGLTRGERESHNYHVDVGIVFHFLVIYGVFLVLIREGVWEMHIFGTVSSIGPVTKSFVSRLIGTNEFPQVKRRRQ